MGSQAIHRIIQGLPTVVAVGVCRHLGQDRVLIVEIHRIAWRPAMSCCQDSFFASAVSDRSAGRAVCAAVALLVEPAAVERRGIHGSRTGFNFHVRSDGGR